jgi:hypothetical protein
MQLPFAMLFVKRRHLLRHHLLRHQRHLLKVLRHLLYHLLHLYSRRLCSFEHLALPGELPARLLQKQHS